MAGGISFQITPLLAITGEYRYIFYPGFKLTDRSLTYETDVRSHSVVVGISLRF